MLLIICIYIRNKAYHQTNQRLQPRPNARLQWRQSELPKIVKCIKIFLSTLILFACFHPVQELLRRRRFLVNQRALKLKRQGHNEPQSSTKYS